MRVLVVGASGLLGRSLVSVFNAAGHEVFKPLTQRKSLASLRRRQDPRWITAHVRASAVRIVLKKAGQELAFVWQFIFV